MHLGYLAFSKPSRPIADTQSRAMALNNDSIYRAADNRIEVVNLAGGCSGFKVMRDLLAFHWVWLPRCLPVAQPAQLAC